MKPVVVNFTPTLSGNIHLNGLDHSKPDQTVPLSRNKVKLMYYAGFWTVGGSMHRDNIQTSHRKDPRQNEDEVRREC